MPKHTPGPWRYKPSDPGYIGSRLQPSEPNYAATIVKPFDSFPADWDRQTTAFHTIATFDAVGYCAPTTDEYGDGWRNLGDPDANAQLAAAAPKLLEVCRKARAAFKVFGLAVISNDIDLGPELAAAMGVFEGIGAQLDAAITAAEGSQPDDLAPCDEDGNP